MKSTTASFMFTIGLLFSTNPAQAQAPCLPINFEFVPGAVPAVGLVIGNQYMLPNGVRFSVRTSPFTTAPLMRLGDYNGQVAEGWISDDSDRDELAAPFNFGRFFLAHPDTGSQYVRDLIIDYTTPTDELSFDLLDVDGVEHWRIVAFDAMNNEVTSREVNKNSAFAGDTRPLNVSLRSPTMTNEIVRVEVRSLAVNKGKLGFGFDNFAPTCSRAFCGNGLLDPGEQCDDGNTNQEDDCFNNCTGICNILMVPSYDPDNCTLSLYNVSSYPGGGPTDTFSWTIKDINGITIYFSNTEVTPTFTPAQLPPGVYQVCLAAFNRTSNCQAVYCESVTIPTCGLASFDAAPRVPACFAPRHNAPMTTGVAGEAAPACKGRG